RRLDCLELAEEEAPLAIGPVPVLQQPPGRRGDARMAFLAPGAHLGADAVYFFVGTDSIGGPLRLHRDLASPPPGLRNRHEVGAQPACLHHLVGDPVLAEEEVPGWLLE